MDAEVNISAFDVLKCLVLNLQIDLFERIWRTFAGYPSGIMAGEQYWGPS